MSRRRAAALLAGLTTALAALGLPIVRRERRRRLDSTHSAAPPDPSPVARSLLGRLAAFAGALHGDRLDAGDKRSLEDDLEFVLQTDGGWRPEFLQAADYIDRLARRHQAADFERAPEAVQELVIDQVMRLPVDGRRSQILALISADERTRRRLRGGIVPVLATAYRASAGAWRRRGYQRRPGFPGDPSDYTRQGPTYPC